MSRPRERIALLDHVGFGNLGDEATLAAVLQNVRSRRPEVEFIGLTLNPDQTERVHGIKSFPIHRDCGTLPGPPSAEGKYRSILSKHSLLWAILRVLKGIVVRWPRTACRELMHLAKSYQALRAVSLLVIAGGGQLRDKAFGPYAFPYTIWKWTILARIRNARCYFISLGAGPLETASGRFFVSNALKFSAYTSFRDARSQELIRGLGWKGSSSVRPDCVYGYTAESFQISPRPAGRSNKLIGISPMRVYWDRNPQVYSDLIRELGIVGGWLAENQNRLCLFSTENPSDDEPIENLRQSILNRNTTAAIECPKIQSLADLSRCMSELDYIVTCRFHGVVFAHLMNIPVLAIAHHPKVSTLMADLGLAEYCFDINSYSSEAIKRTLTKLFADSEEIRFRMREQVLSNRIELLAQFDLLFPSRRGVLALELPRPKHVSMN